MTVGAADQLARSGLRASAPHWVAARPQVGEALHARVRYHAPAVGATVSAIGDDSFCVEFEHPVGAIAPGQAVVLYRGDEVVGGGTIEAHGR